MPYITYSSGLTIKSPTRGTRNYEQTMRTDTYQKISEHDHSGGGRGAQLGGGAIANDGLNDLKIKLRNNQYLRARNFADNADINILKVNAADNIQLGANIHSAITLSLSNNASTTLGLTLDPLTVIGATLYYSVKRVGASTITEAGQIAFKFDGSSWETFPERLGNAGITFAINSSGVLSYTTTDLASHVSSNMYILAVTTGV